MIDLDYTSPRGISVREGLSRLTARSTRTESGCLIGPLGPDTYHEITASGQRLGAHVAVVLVRGDDPSDRVVRHTCDTPGCIESAHLIVGTQAQNVRDEYDRSRRTEGWARGENRPNAQMTEDDVREMRRRHASGASLGEVTAEFQFEYAAVRSAIRGESWKHITDVPPVPGRKNKAPHHASLRRTRADDARRALELSNSGLSLREIAKELDVPRTTAWKLVNIAREQVPA